MPSIDSKILSLKHDFLKCLSNEARYQKIMEKGKSLTPFDPAWKVEEALVQGCQSIMYLHAQLEQGRLFFSAASDALISAGLAAILIEVYSGQTPEDILRTPPTFLEELEIVSSLTPSRANGLASLYLKMKQEAMQVLVVSSR